MAMDDLSDIRAKREKCCGCLTSVAASAGVGNAPVNPPPYIRHCAGKILRANFSAFSVALFCKLEQSLSSCRLWLQNRNNNRQKCQYFLLRYFYVFFIKKYFNTY